MKKRNNNIIILGLGSNIGDRKRFLDFAIEQLATIINNIKSSPIYESEAILTEDAPESWNMPYLNMVVTGETDLSPDQLLEVIQRIEEKAGRKRGIIKWPPRQLDIDILAFNDQVINQENLIIPHYAMLERDFVLLPLADIAPDWIYPVTGKYFGKSAKELAENLILDRKSYLYT